MTNASFNPILRPQFLEASTPPPNTRHVLYLGTARPRSLVPARPATCSRWKARCMSIVSAPTATSTNTGGTVVGGTTGAPLAIRNPTAYVFPAENTQHVVFNAAKPSHHRTLLGPRLGQCLSQGADRKSGPLCFSQGLTALRTVSEPRTAKLSPTQASQSKRLRLLRCAHIGIFPFTSLRHS